MSVKSYYRRMLALPLLLPGLALPLQWVPSLPGVVEAFVFLMTWSLLLGGVPYLLFATGFLLWMRRVPDRSVRIGILLSPLVYTCVLVVCLTLFLLVDGSLAHSSDSVGGLVLFGLSFGYAYVALAELGRLLLRPGTPRPEPVPAV
jgi:hypothetical protein